MTIYEIIVLALIQGITEFLPISSSGHLLLPAQLFGWTEQGLAFDVAVHVGSLLAVVIYFRQDIAQMTVAWLASLTGKHSDNSKLAWLVILSTIPAVIFGFAFKSYVEIYARSALVLACTTIGFGLLLWWADAKSKQTNNIYQLNWKTALFIGLMQVLAIIPGTSRSGITMTAGLMAGLNRESAARFSFLLSIPTILGAGVLLSFDLVAEPAQFDWTAMALGVAFSFISAYACIALFLKWINQIGMLPFVIYRLLLGAVLLVFVFG